MTPDERLAWDTAINRIAKQDYRSNPVAWVQNSLKEHPWSVQRDVMMSVAQNRLTAVQSCHGIGKSWLASRLVLWFIDTRPLNQVMVVTSAPTAHQVRAVLWKYVRQGHESGGLPGYISQAQVPEWKIDGNLVGFGRRPADHQQSAFQGQHAPHLLVILDEACGIPKWLWDASDSLMTGEENQHLLAIGNPDDNSSHFYTICTTEQNWQRFQVSAFDCPAFTGEQVPTDVLPLLTGPTYVEDKKVRWGVENPLYKIKVLGEFVDSEDGLIPMSWVKAANARWHKWNEWYRETRYGLGQRIYGVDVARYGTDSTVIVTRENDVIYEIESYPKQSTMVTANIVKAKLDASVKSLAVVDVIGVGAGVVDRLDEWKANVSAYNAAEATKVRDVTGNWRFKNVRSASWWNLRELLDPSRGATLALPDHDQLTADLVTPQWRIGTGNILIVEEKEEIRKRLGRSPDFGDALVMAMWQNTGTGRARPEDGDGVEPNRPLPPRPKGGRTRRHVDSVFSR